MSAPSVLVGGVAVDDCMDQLVDRHLGLDGVEESDELLVAMALHVAADNGAFEDIEGGEQRRGTVAFVIVFIGNPGWVRSKAWIWFFSSTERATA
jgi:hypothetical protein